MYDDGQWILVTAWCPACWFKREATFHEQATKEAMLEQLQRSHRNAHPHCKEALRLEGTKGKKK